MFGKIKHYMGSYIGYTCAALAAMFAGLIASAVPFFMVYRIIKPLLDGETVSAGYIAVHIAVIFACELAYAILYVWGLKFSHISAYNTLKIIRISLQKKLERQPLGAIHDMGNGRIKKLFTDDIDQVELLLAHAIPEGISNLSMALIAVICMFLSDWKLALEKEVLHGVSLELGEGTLTALVGESGSGKSMLAKLLVHYYDISGGHITLGGQDITDMSIEALNDNISYVSQEQFLFNTTLYENILIGKPDATREEVLSAAEKAQCNEFLKRLPDGIDTMAGDGGKQLSGGERQRISLARAILKNAPVIVLDEATAFIDPENEEKMNAAISEIIKDKTVLVIAHRLQTIVNADRICVMKDGNIIAADTHENLLQNCDEYQKLWNSSEARANWQIGNEMRV